MIGCLRKSVRCARSCGGQGAEHLRPLPGVGNRVPRGRQHATLLSLTHRRSTGLLRLCKPQVAKRALGRVGFDRVFGQPIEAPNRG